MCAGIVSPDTGMKTDETQIRASAYALCLGGRVLSFLLNLFCPKSNAESFGRSVTSAMSIQGLALLSTAIYQTAHARLTLFHAVVVLHLLALLGITLATRGKYAGNESARSIIDTVGMLLSFAAFISFNVYMWIKAPTFGSQPECNSGVVYVIFGVSIQATNDVFRYIILATFAIVPGIFMIFFILLTPCLIAAWCCWGRNEGWESRQPRRGSYDGESAADENRRIHESIQIVAYVAFAIYAIVSLEQMISRNRVSEEERYWTFGQVLSLFLLLGVANEAISAVIASINKNSERSGGSRNVERLEMRP